MNKNMALRTLFAVLCLLIFITGSLPAQDYFVMSGSVTDSSTREPLVTVNIRIAGTSKGTISNASGFYSLSVPSGPQTIIFSSIGYQPETLRVTVSQPLTKNIVLVESPVQVPEIVVLAEDPALEIIRKAIANKRAWMNKLTSYKFEAFTRQVLRRDTSIASITESYTTGFQKVGDTLKEIIRQKRQTENISMDDNFASVRGIVNFNEDKIELFRVGVNRHSSAYAFRGPTAPDALEYYDYQLLGTSTVNGVEIYKIKMTPKSRLTPLFEGIITVADQTFAVMGVDVKPNETLNLPFIKDIDLRYKQQFSLYDSIFWMPTDIRIHGSFGVSVVGFSLPHIGIDQTSAIYDYSVNMPIPDSILQKPRLTTDSSAVRYDSSFWKQNEVLPLTTEEKNAYQSLDSTQTLDKQFEPKGPLSSLGGDDTGGILEHIDARFNRVEGFFFGGKATFDSIVPGASFRIAAGYGFSDTVFKYNAGATYFIDHKHKFGFRGDVYRSLENIPDEGYYGVTAITLMSLIDKNDYRDYYLATGWNAFALFNPTGLIHTELGFVHQQERTAQNNTDYSLFAKSKVFRANPFIEEGLIQSVIFNIDIGEQESLLGLVSRDALHLSVEQGMLTPISSNSTLSFTRLFASAEYNIMTFGADLLFPAMLRIKLSGGILAGNKLPQRLFSLESQASAYAPFGVLKGADVKEFTGDRFIMLNIEHNFRSLPFLALDIPFLYENGIELITHASLAKTWIEDNQILLTYYSPLSPPTLNGWYTEAGIGINRIFDILRTDFTYRFTNPSGFYFTVSVANLF